MNEPLKREKTIIPQKKAKRKYKIFIVEDSDVFRELITRYVEDIGSREHFIKNEDFEIHSFTTGEECLQSLDLNPDIVLLDYYLNGNPPKEQEEMIDGLEVLKQIKSICPDSKIVAVTAQGDFWVSTQFYLWGAADYISKGPGIREKIQKSIKKMVRLIDAEDERRAKNEGMSYE